MAEYLDKMVVAQRVAGKTQTISDRQIVLLDPHIKNPDLFMDKINLPEVPETVSSVLQEEFILSNFNASHSGKNGGTRIHIDSRLPITNFEHTIQIVALLCLDDFTPKNSFIYVWPNSLTSGEDPKYIRGTMDVPGKIQG